MPELVRLLRSQDLGHVKVVAELWGLDVRLPDLDSGAEAAAAAMLDAGLAREVVEALESAARAALDALLEAGGRMPWPVFSRQFGDVREMGAGRRDREKPHRQPDSPAETLFYRAFLGRAFFDTDEGPREFAYVPEDLMRLIEAASPRASSVEPPGKAAPPRDCAHVRPAGDAILDEATTLLAALRTGESPSKDAVLRALLESAGILRAGAPQAEQIRSFLELPRDRALRNLVEPWRLSASFNELRLMPGLVCEGTWLNQPLAAREFILAQLRAVPRGTWWSLPALISGIREKHPDFQRPVGDYDSWFIKRAADGSYLRGFSSWDEVDGALIRFMVTGVMHRLGLVELASPEPGDAPVAFRVVPPSAIHSVVEDGKLHVSAQGAISAGSTVARAVRYQLARFCAWLPPRGAEHRYRLTPASLSRATRQGLSVEQLLALLANHADAGIPPSLVKALKRWEAHGTEARIETQVVLRADRPEVIRQLRTSRAGRFLGESLGPAAVAVKDGAQERVAAALAELGLLAADETGAQEAGTHEPASEIRKGSAQ